MHLLVFEDSDWANFAPLTLSRPVSLLRAGTGTMLARQLATFQPTRLTMWVRPGLEELARGAVAGLKIPVSINTTLDDGPVLICNARLIPRGDEGGETVRAGGLSPDDCRNGTPAWRAVADSPLAAPASPRFIWDLVHSNAERIVADAGRLGPPPPHPPGPYHMVNPAAVYLRGNVKLVPGVVLDASGGAIVIDEGASIGANSVLEGPCHIADRATIVPQTLIRAGTSIGPNCKIGGEVARSIFWGDGNKVHFGYVGDSYVGQWANLGAGATTSNLKNTYGSVSVRIGSRQIDTGLQFFGSIIGDHSKMAISTRLMTGTYVGYCANVVTGGLPPRFIPSFTFLTERGSEAFRPEKAREIMTRVYARRGMSWGKGDEELVHFARAAAEIVER